MITLRTLVSITTTIVQIFSLVVLSLFAVMSRLFARSDAPSSLGRAPARRDDPDRDLVDFTAALTAGGRAAAASRSVGGSTGSQGASIFNAFDDRNPQILVDRVIVKEDEEDAKRSSGFVLPTEVPAGPGTAKTSICRLFKIPKGRDFEEMCFGRFPTSQTFCVRRNCSTSHQSTEKFPAQPNDLYVLKNHLQCYQVTSLSEQCISGGLFYKWFETGSGKSLDEWSETFQAARDAYEAGGSWETVTEEDLNAALQNRQRARAYRTPFRPQTVVKSELSV